MEKINLIAADIGAGSGRMAMSVFNGKKITSKEIHRFENGPVLLGDTLYWDFLNMMKELGKGLKKANSVTDGEIASIGIDSWGADFGLLDKNGDLLSNPVSYRDKRIFIAEKEINEIISSNELNRLNSSLTYNHSTLYQLFYVYKYQRQLAGLIDKYLPIADLIGFFLTGGKIADTSMFSGSQFFNVKERVIKDDLLIKFGIDKDIIPPIKDAGTTVGNINKTYAESLSLKPGIKVSLVCGHDTASAVTGIPLEGNSCFINSGTWSVMGVESGDAFTSDEIYRNDFTNWNTIGDRIIFLQIFNGFYFIQELKKIWDMEDGRSGDYKDFYGRIKIDDYTGSLVNIKSRLLLEPGRIMTGKIADFLKNTCQKALDSRDEIIISILQSLVIEYKLVLDQLKKYSGKKIEKIYMVGGGSLNKVFCQWTADCLGIPVYTGYPEATVNGNTIVQLMALGKINNIEDGREIIRNSFNEVIYEPLKRKKERWDILIDKYMEIKKLDKKEGK